MLDTDKGEEPILNGLSVEGLNAFYPGGRGVSRVSGMIQEGKITAIIGPNGSGKSTLLRAIAGTMDFSGSVHFRGVDLSSLAKSAMARTVAFVDQVPRMGYPFPVLDVLRMGRLPYGRKEPYGPDSLKRAFGAAESLNLLDLMDRPVTRLSGGETQRVVVARAFVQDCPVMLLDEPTSALDPGHSAGLFKLLRGLSGSGKTVLVTVHDVNLAVAFADSVWAMKNGEVIEKGSPDKVIDEDLLLKLYGMDFCRYDDGEGGSRWFFR